MVSTDAPCQEHSGFVSLMPLKAGFEFLKLEENGKAFRKSITSSGSVTHTNEACSHLFSAGLGFVPFFTLK
ncbi:hypothetical protein B5E77_01730 [Lachnoclostridium sp. An131]|nr:hypothetical protein B5E77_01730 [Lachnoclostridium sp. An131]